MTAVTEPIPWWQDDARRAEAEQAAMVATAPDLEWLADRGGWRGPVPLWPFDRQQPRGLLDLVGGRPLTVELICSPAHPMTMPTVTPLGVEPPRAALGMATWHLLPGGALCLFQGTAWWDPAWPAAGLIAKISGWYVEYHLMMRGCIEQMPDRGVDVGDALDDLISRCADDGS